MKFRIYYSIEGYYKNRNTGEREWLKWMDSPSETAATKSFDHGLKLITSDVRGFSELRVMEIKEEIKVLKSTKE